MKKMFLIVLIGVVVSSLVTYYFTSKYSDNGCYESMYKKDKDGYVVRGDQYLVAISIKELCKNSRHLDDQELVEVTTCKHNGKKLERSVFELNIPWMVNYIADGDHLERGKRIWIKEVKLRKTGRNCPVSFFILSHKPIEMKGPVDWEEKRKLSFVNNNNIYNLDPRFQEKEISDTEILKIIKSQNPNL